MKIGVYYNPSPQLHACEEQTFLHTCSYRNQQTEAQILQNMIKVELINTSLWIGNKKVSLWQSKEEMRHPSWAPSAPHLTLQIYFFLLVSRGKLCIYPYCRIALAIVFYFIVNNYYTIKGIQNSCMKIGTADQAYILRLPPAPSQ